MLSNESFGVKVRFGAIYSASKTKEYFLKNKMVGNRPLPAFRIRKHWNYLTRKFELVASSVHLRATCF